MTDHPPAPEPGEDEVARRVVRAWEAVAYALAAVDGAPDEDWLADQLANLEQSAAALVGEVDAWPATEYGLCPYRARWQGYPGSIGPEAVCAFDCHDEPFCVTSAPPGGWPWYGWAHG